MEFLLSVISIYLAFFYIKKINNSILSISILLLLIWIYFIFPILYYSIFLTYLLPGKPDQYGYLEFAKIYSLKSINDIVAIAYQKQFHNFFYWQISSLLYKFSLFSPIFSLRSLNFIIHLLLSILTYYIVKLFSQNQKKSFIASLIILISPTFTAFGLYILRDLLIVLSFAGFFLSILLICKYGFKLKYFLLLILFSLVSFSLREHLILIEFLFFLNVLLYKLIKIQSIIFYIIINLISLTFLNLLIEITPLKDTNFHTLNNILNFIISLEFIKSFIWKFPLYLTGLGFLDPTAEKTSPLSLILLTRLIAIDSLLVPLLFTWFLIKNLKKNILIKIFLIVFIVYFSIYMYAQEFWQGYGFHFRAMLPFFYIMYVFLISKSNIVIKGNKK